MTVRSVDKGMGRFLNALDDLTKPRSITVGVHADVGAAEHPGPTRATVAQVAAYQEFGTDVDPPTAFVRGAADAFGGEQRLVTASERALRSALYGTSESGHADRAFARVGEQLARAMRRRVPVATGAVQRAIAVKINGVAVDEVA